MLDTLAAGTHIVMDRYSYSGVAFSAGEPEHNTSVKVYFSVCVQPSWAWITNGAEHLRRACLSRTFCYSWSCRPKRRPNGAVMEMRGELTVSRATSNSSNYYTDVQI
jgi:hypothetical protein